MAKNNTRKRTAAGIPPASKARIVELSLQHPDFGAKRLLHLLSKEGIAISVSSVYNVMKRNGLQKREKRFARIQARQALEALPRTAGDDPSPVEASEVSPGDPQPKTQPWKEDRPPVSRGGAVKVPFHRGRPDLEASAKNKARIPLALKLVSVSLLAVLAFSGFRTALKFHRARQEPQTAAAIVPSPIHVEETAAEIASVTALVENNAVRKSDQPDMGSRLESFSDAPPPYHSGTWQHVDSPWSFDLGFEELVAWLADARRLWQEATIDPYMKDALPAGFTITDLKPDAIYQKMGLQNGDIIQGVNGEAVTGPEQVAFFFQRVAEGGVVEIKIKRRRRTRYISLTIQ